MTRIRTLIVSLVAFLTGAIGALVLTAATAQESGRHFDSTLKDQTIHITPKAKDKAYLFVGLSDNNNPVSVSVQSRSATVPINGIENYAVFELISLCDVWERKGGWVGRCCEPEEEGCPGPRPPWHLKLAKSQAGVTP